MISNKRIFENFFGSEHIFHPGSHVKFPNWQSVWKSNLIENQALAMNSIPKTPAKFEFTQLSCFREEDWSLQTMDENKDNINGRQVTAVANMTLSELEELNTDLQIKFNWSLFNMVVSYFHTEKSQTHNLSIPYVYTTCVRPNLYGYRFYFSMLAWSRDPLLLLTFTCTQRSTGPILTNWKDNTIHSEKW